ncbi:DedA family protein [Brevibacillus sp. SYSU BS000544]|uniref:DedA family protein n=1 Tax=Brevibacillus sp. SYSU BS000544 TaxID=3416443 RepID=UPI003CE584CA
MLTNIWETILFITGELGYWGVLMTLIIEGMGLPFPGDAVLAFYGFLASDYRFTLLAVILVATVGSWLGSIVAFYLGKRFGLPLLYRYGKFLLISERSIEVTSRFSGKYGVLVLLFGRMLPGIRTLSSYIAGIGNLSWPVFLIYSFAGLWLFCTFWISVGFFLGENWNTFVLIIKEYLVRILIGVILLGGSLLLWRKTSFMTRGR